MRYKYVLPDKDNVHVGDIVRFSSSSDAFHTQFRRQQFIGKICEVYPNFVRVIYQRGKDKDHVECFKYSEIEVLEYGRY